MGGVFVLVCLVFGVLFRTLAAIILYPILLSFCFIMLLGILGAVRGVDDLPILRKEFENLASLMFLWPVEFILGAEGSV